MSEGLFHEADSGETGNNLRTFIGLILVVAGVGIGFWTILNIFTIFSDPTQLEVFRQIVPDDPEIREMDFEGKKITLPAGLFHGIAYGVGSFLLFVAAILAGGLISGGVSLLQPSVQKLQNKIISRLDGLKKQLAEMAITLEKQKTTDKQNDNT